MPEANGPFPGGSSCRGQGLALALPSGAAWVRLARAEGLPLPPVLTVGFPALQFPAACGRAFTSESGIERDAIDKALGGQSHLAGRAASSAPS